MHDADGLTSAHDQYSNTIMKMGLTNSPACVRWLQAARQLRGGNRLPDGEAVICVELEVPFSSATGSVVGFADACYSYGSGRKLWIEIKTDDTQTGALIRQIKQYRTMATKAAFNACWEQYQRPPLDPEYLAAMHYAESIARDSGGLWAALIPLASDRTVAMLQNEGIIVVGL